MLEFLQKDIAEFIPKDLNIWGFVDDFKEYVIKVVRDIEKENKLSEGSIKKALAVEALILIYDEIDKHFDFDDNTDSLFKDTIIPKLIDSIISYLNQNMKGWESSF